MSIIINSNYDSLPQQVQINKQNIADLQNTQAWINTPYRYDGELTPDTTAVDTSTLTNIVGDSTVNSNGYVVDELGSYFKIVNVVDTTVYLRYLFTIKGDQGVGIKELQYGTPTINGEFTFTPVTVVLSDDTQQTLEVSAKNGVSITDVEFSPVASQDTTQTIYRATTTISDGTTLESGDIVIPPSPIYRCTATITLPSITVNSGGNKTYQPVVRTVFYNTKPYTVDTNATGYDKLKSLIRFINTNQQSGGENMLPIPVTSYYENSQTGAIMAYGLKYSYESDTSGNIIMYFTGLLGPALTISFQATSHQYTPTEEGYNVTVINTLFK